MTKKPSDTTHWLKKTGFLGLLLLHSQPALPTTAAAIPDDIGEAPTFVDIDNDGDQDFFIKANDGTIIYHENIGNVNQPKFVQRTGAANPLSGVHLGTVSSPSRSTKQGEKPEPLKITDYSKETLYLSAEQTSADFFITVNDHTRVEEAAIVIRLPRTEDIPPEDSEPIVHLPCRFTATTENILKYPGQSEIYYYIKEKGARDYLDRLRSVVYKDKVGNLAPTPFNLYSPNDGAETSLNFQLDWEKSTDPENQTFNYTLLIAEDPDFKKVVYHREEIYVEPHESIKQREVWIDDETFFEDGSQGLKDLTTYYWKVEAVDDYGDTTPSLQVFSFRTNKGNPAYNPERSDYEDDGILGEPSFTNPLVVNALEWGRYLVTLTKTGNNRFTVTKLQPTDQTDKYEATFHPVTNRVSIPGYGGMELIPNSSPLQFRPL